MKQSSLQYNFHVKVMKEILDGLTKHMSFLWKQFLLTQWSHLDLTSKILCKSFYPTELYKVMFQILYIFFLSSKSFVILRNMYALWLKNALQHGNQWTQKRHKRLLCQPVQASRRIIRLCCISQCRSPRRIIKLCYISQRRPHEEL